MVDFRKALLLLAVVALMGSIASAQIICTANAGNPPIVRGEGLAEKVGEVIISCQGGTSVLWNQPLPTINVQIFLSTYITSRLTVDGGIASEAMLLIDEPQPARQLVCAQNVLCPVYGLGGGNYAGGLGGTANPTSLPAANDYQRPSMFQGAKNSDNSIVWSNVPFDPPGTNGSRIMRIVNIRANAYNAGVSSSLTPTGITMYISISGTSGLTLINPQNTVAWTQYGLGITAKAKTYKQCEPTRNSDGSWTSKDPIFPVNIQELFPSAFLVAPASTAVQNIPGQDYKTEAAFWNGSTAPFAEVGAVSGKITTSIGAVSRATRIIVRFTNIPSNLSIYIPGTIAAVDGSASLALDSGTGVGSSGSNGYPVSISSGSASVQYDVTVANTGVQSFDGNANPVVLPLKLSWTAAALPPPQTVTVAVLFGNTSTDGLMRYGGTYPRFMDIPRATTTFTIAQCRTNLLFPYVTNQAGFDTGLVIANTSIDPWGTAGQSGTCTLNYYGNVAGGGAVQGPATSASVTAGTQLIWLLSTGNQAMNIPANPGFGGYIIAQCNFQYGHGYGYISNYGGGNAQGYLALVMDDALTPSRTGSSSEVLGN